MTAAKTEGCYYIRNTLRGNYIEWYAEKNNWSSYGTINHEELFAQKFYKVTDLPQPPAAELPEEGAAGVLYNKSAGQYGHEGVLGLQDDNETSPSILDVSAVLQEGKAVPANGGVVFTARRTASGTVSTMRPSAIWPLTAQEAMLSIPPRSARISTGP